MKWPTIGEILYAPVKVLGWFLVWQAIPRRASARNIVYNYVLQRNKTKWLGRLWQREPLKLVTGWQLKDIHNVGWTGWIQERHVSTIQFYWCVLTTWGWLDDDSNEDTTDWGHISRRHPSCIEGVRRPDFGNTFDLGDLRAKWPFFKPCATYWWNMRNSAMNFQYLWRNY